MNLFCDKLLLAPIAGYSDAGMRSLCYEYGADICFTEMVSAKGLFYKNDNTSALLHLSEKETNTGVQLFGSEPSIIAEVSRYPEIQKFPIIDINMGCPVRKIVSNDEGSALLRNPTLIYDIIKSLKTASKKIITAKLRIGIDGKTSIKECALAVQEGGADMVTVHGRTKEQLYTGKVNYDIIAEVKQTLSIPVCGNGDVTDFDSYKRMKDTGVDSVMIARGAMGRPYIFSELRQKEYSYSISDTIKKHIGYLNFLPEKTVVNLMKKQIACYVYGMRGGKSIKEKAFNAETLQDLLSIFQE